MSKVPSCELHQVELHETCHKEKIFQGRHSFVQLGKDQNALSLNRWENGCNLRIKDD